MKYRDATIHYNESAAYQAKFTGFFIGTLLFIATTCIAMATNPTKNCHCFKDRTYNQAKKFSSDSYILTTTTNSFISAWFDFEKKNIVMMKMKGGVKSDDLLIGLYLASLSRDHINTLMNLRKQGATWKTILSRTETKAKVKNDQILSSMLEGLGPRDGATQIIDLLLVRFFSVGQEQLASLHRRNLSAKEITLLLTLSAKSGIDVGTLADFARKQGLSYSEIAFNLGFQPSDMKKVITELKADATKGQ